MKRLLPWLALAGAVIGFANFAWFMAETVSLGGDALSGYIRDGHYFVSSHGTVTEVSRADWEWSRLHAGVTFPIFLIGMAGMAYLLFRVFFPAMLPSQAAPDPSKRLDLVRASGPEIASRRFAGQLGDLRISGPMLDVSVHPAGIVLKPPFMDPVILLADELTGITWDKGWWGTSRLTINQDPGAWAGPIRLYLGQDEPVASAIDDLIKQRPTNAENRRLRCRVPRVHLKSASIRSS